MRGEKWRKQVSRYLIAFTPATGNSVFRVTLPHEEFGEEEKAYLWFSEDKSKVYVSDNRDHAPKHTNSRRLSVRDALSREIAIHGLGEEEMGPFFRATEVTHLRQGHVLTLNIPAATARRSPAQRAPRGSRSKRAQATKTHGTFGPGEHARVSYSAETQRMRIALPAKGIFQGDVDWVNISFNSESRVVTIRRVFRTDENAVMVQDRRRDKDSLTEIPFRIEPRPASIICPITFEPINVKGKQVDRDTLELYLPTWEQLSAPTVVMPAPSSQGTSIMIHGHEYVLPDDMLQATVKQWDVMGYRK